MASRKTVSRPGELVREGGELAQLDHVVDGHLGGAEAVGRSGDRVRRGGELLLAQIEARQDDGLAVKALRDVDVGVDHGA